MFWNKVCFAYWLIVPITCARLCNIMDYKVIDRNGSQSLVIFVARLGRIIKLLPSSRSNSRTLSRFHLIHLPENDLPPRRRLPILTQYLIKLKNQFIFVLLAHFSHIIDLLQQNMLMLDNPRILYLLDLAIVYFQFVLFGVYTF